MIRDVNNADDNTAVLIINKERGMFSSLLIKKLAVKNKKLIITTTWISFK